MKLYEHVGTSHVNVEEVLRDNFPKNLIWKFRTSNFPTYNTI